MNQTAGVPQAPLLPGQEEDEENNINMSRWSRKSHHSQNVVKWGYDVVKNVPTTEEDQNICPLHQDPHIYTPGIVISQNLTFIRVLCNKINKE